MLIYRLFLSIIHCYYLGSRLTGYGVYTKPGREEKYRPYLSIRLPDALMKTHYEHNALKNRFKLIGMHDIHQTLRQFLNINKGQYYENEHRLNIHTVRSLRGVSLFEEIPINRSCYDVLIPYGQCYCGKSEKLSEDEFYKHSKLTSTELKDILLNEVVKLTNSYRHKCVVYEFKEILSITRKQFNNSYIYTFEYLLEPGRALFNVPVLLNKDIESIEL